VNGLKPDKKVVATNLAMYAEGGNGIWKSFSRDSVIQVLVMPNIGRFQKPCQVYYYQTKAPIAKKYGIAACADKRAKTGNRWGHYMQKLSVFDCETRAEAIAIEASLRQCLTAGWTEEEYAEWAQVTNMSSCELARESKQEFDSIFLDLQKQYRELGNGGFIRKYLAHHVSQFERLADQLLKGDLEIVVNSFDDSIAWIAKQELESLGPSTLSGLKTLKLEEAPEQFQKQFGFKLIPDSAWH